MHRRSTVISYSLKNLRRSKGEVEDVLGVNVELDRLIGIEPTAVDLKVHRSIVRLLRDANRHLETASHDASLLKADGRSATHHGDTNTDRRLFTRRLELEPLERRRQRQTTTLATARESRRQRKEAIISRNNNYYEIDSRCLPPYVHTSLARSDD